MRKAVIAVALASGLASLVPAQAANYNRSFTIQRSGALAPTAPLRAPCVTQNFPGHMTDCKGTYFMPARCLFVTDRGTAQSGNEGLIAYVFRINAAKIRGSNVQLDNDNKFFDLRVTDSPVVPKQNNVAGELDVPDVDIAFYQSLGSCPADMEVANTTIPLGGSAAVTLKESFLAKSLYTGPGDEINRRFPSGYYDNPDNPLEIKRADKYFAIVTVIGGVDVKVTMTCKDCPDNNWYEQL